MNLSEEDWKKKLNPDQYKVLRQNGTEAPFSGKYLSNNKKGSYRCVACGAELFSSDAKYESNMPGLAGWPSFSDVASSGSVKIKQDNSLGMVRQEIICANCEGHLGHVFDGDSDSPTGKHFCINSVCLEFEQAKKVKD